MKKLHRSGQRRAATSVPEPHVGIFWLVDGKPLIDSTALSEAEDYGDFKTILRAIWRLGVCSNRTASRRQKSNTKNFPVGASCITPRPGDLRYWLTGAFSATRMWSQNHVGAEPAYEGHGKGNRFPL
jgi:hypothetical protein